MAIGAKQHQIGKVVIGSFAVDMVQLHGEGIPKPGFQTAFLAPVLLYPFLNQTFFEFVGLKVRM
jgi:hypothetical protein